MIRIKPSNRNTNKHTEKGMQLLSTSIDEVGVIESISVTKQGTIISGHARKEKFDEKGLVPKEITLAENEYPVIVRNDIEDNTDTYYKAQILANTTAHQNYNIDLEEVEAVASEYNLDINTLGIEISEANNDEDFIEYGDDNVYTKKIKSPHYEITEDKPHYSTLTNDKKTQSLIQEIQKANISKEDKDFLIKAAHRHTVFDYGKIAEYYAHSDKEVQELMEKSALVIIDFNKAIEYGYVKLSNEVAEQYNEEYEE